MDAARHSSRPTKILKNVAAHLVAGAGMVESSASRRLDRLSGPVLGSRLCGLPSGL
jgi:uncharacterized protein YaaW (UPF0174 family)